MPEEDRQPDALVRVAPRLLSDALCIVLRDAGLQVSVCPPVDRRREPRPTRHFDVAVVSGELPDDADCDRVLRIDGRGAMLDDAGRPVGEPGIEGLLQEVRKVLGGRTVQGSPSS